MSRARRVVVVLGTLALAAGTPAGAGQPPPFALQLDDFVGRYELTPAFHVTVTREGRGLFLQATGQDRLPLTPRGGLEFVIVGTNLRVVFGVREDTGEVFDLLFEQAGLGRRAVKLEADAVSEGPVVVNLPRTALEELVGTYEEQPGFAMTIRLDRDGLVAALTGLPGVSIAAISEWEFIYPDGRGRITFQRDGAGEVVSLVLHQGGSDVEMRRRE